MNQTPLTWIALFMITCNLMGIACLYRCFRMGSQHGWSIGAKEIGIFLLFCGTGYFVESWAHARTPYYHYSPDFPDRVQRVYVEGLPFFKKPDRHDCSDKVNEIVDNELGGRPIPLVIPIMEGSLAFAALWTSRLLKAPIWVRPLLAGWVLVNVDALVDPIVATTHNCHGDVLRQGLNFWHWYIDDTYIAHWYGIPVFNFVGWFGAAVMLVSFAHLIGWGSDVTLWAAPKVVPRMKSSAPPPSGEEAWNRRLHSNWPPRLEHGILWCFFFGAPALVLVVSPSFLKEPPSHSFQWAALVVTLGVTGAAVLSKARRFHTKEPEAADLTRALILPVLFGVFAFLISKQFMETPTFFIIALITAALGALLCWWPYEEATQRFSWYVADVDRFIRLHYVGYPWMLVLLGGALAVLPLKPSPGPVAPLLPGGTIGVLLGVALCFHIYSCVLNDVLDMDLDKTQVRRQQDPLIRGEISRTAAHVFALLQLPIIVLLTQLVGGSFVSLALIGAASLLMGAYNWWGKRCPIPPITDFIQGLAWGALALYGAVTAGKLGDIRDLGPLPWVIFAYGAGFMLLINGVHGGLRDLANDIKQKRKNTAIFFGAKPSADDPYTVFSTAKLAVFAFAIQTLMLGLMAWQLYQSTDYYAPVTGIHLEHETNAYKLLRDIIIGLFLFVVIWCHLLLWRLVQPGWAKRDEAGSMHAFAILLPPLIVFTFTLDPVMQVVVPFCYFVPLLAQFAVVGKVFAALGQGPNRLPPPPPPPVVAETKGVASLLPPPLVPPSKEPA